MKKLSIFLTLAGVIIAGITLYYQVIRKQNNIIEIATIDKAQLAIPPNVDGLSVEYRWYNDSIPLQNLWRVKYIIRNTGDINIIGEGAKSILVNPYLPFSFNSDCKILKVELVNENNGAIIQDTCLFFKQWKPNEFIELIAYLECYNGEPILTIDNRDIYDSEIKYSQFIPNSKKIEINKRLIDYFTKGWASTLKWITVTTMGILFILTLIGIKEQVKIVTTNKAVTIVAFALLMALLFLPLLWIF